MKSVSVSNLAMEKSKGGMSGADKDEGSTLKQGVRVLGSMAS